MTSVAGGDYKITLASGGQALEAVSDGQTASNGSLNLAPSGDTDAQKWLVEQTGDGSYRIVSKSTGLALTMTIESRRGSTGLSLTAYHGDDT